MLLEEGIVDKGLAAGMSSPGSWLLIEPVVSGAASSSYGCLILFNFIKFGCLI